jgi:hypothetical protein
MIAALGGEGVIEGSRWLCEKESEGEGAKEREGELAGAVDGDHGSPSLNQR